MPHITLFYSLTVTKPPMMPLETQSFAEMQHFFKCQCLLFLKALIPSTAFLHCHSHTLAWAPLGVQTPPTPGSANPSEQESSPALAGGGGCTILPGGCGESFPSLPSARTEQNTLCANRKKPTFPAKVLHSSLFAKWLRYLLWLRLREKLFFKGENKWRCFPPSPFLSTNSGISGLQFLINK